jgi:hypothetical protein
MPTFPLVYRFGLVSDAGSDVKPIKDPPYDSSLYQNNGQNVQPTFGDWWFMAGLQTHRLEQTRRYHAGSNMRSLRQVE